MTKKMSKFEEFTEDVIKTIECQQNINKGFHARLNVLEGKDKKEGNDSFARRPEIDYEWGWNQIERALLKHHVSCANIMNIFSNIRCRSKEVESD